MATYFFSRHPTTIQWIDTHNITYDERHEHLNNDFMAVIQPGDTVIGTLPLHLVASLCERNIIYKHFSINIPHELRDKELTIEELDLCDAQLIRYEVQAIT